MGPWRKPREKRGLDGTGRRIGKEKGANTWGNHGRPETTPAISDAKSEGGMGNSALARQATSPGAEKNRGATNTPDTYIWMRNIPRAQRTTTEAGSRNAEVDDRSIPGQ